jgi:hypothetical protein
MIVDTSVWVEFFNSQDSTASRWVADRIGDEAPLVVPEIMLMELLIGTTPVRDAEDAAAIHRRCRRGGKTVRSLIDCLVAGMALRLDQPVAHHDRDFDVIAEQCGLRTLSLF